MVIFRKNTSWGAFVANYIIMVFFAHICITLAFTIVFRALNLTVLPPGYNYLSAPGQPVYNFFAIKALLASVSRVFAAIWLLQFLLKRRNQLLGIKEFFPDGNPYLSNEKLELQTYEKKMSKLTKEEINIANEELF